MNKFVTYTKATAFRSAYNSSRGRNETGIDWKRCVVVAVLHLDAAATAVGRFEISRPGVAVWGSWRLDQHTSEAGVVRARRDAMNTGHLHPDTILAAAFRLQTRLHSTCLLNAVKVHKQHSENCLLQTRVTLKLVRARVPCQNAAYLVQICNQLTG